MGSFLCEECVHGRMEFGPCLTTPMRVCSTNRRPHGRLQESSVGAWQGRSSAQPARLTFRPHWSSISQSFTSAGVGIPVRRFNTARPVLPVTHRLNIKHHIKGQRTGRVCLHATLTELTTAWPVKPSAQDQRSRSFQCRQRGNGTFMHWVSQTACKDAMRSELCVSSPGQAAKS